MVFQIEYLINESPIKKLIKRPKKLINHEYIKGSFLFNKNFMQRSFYIFMIGTCHYPNILLVTR